MSNHAVDKHIIAPEKRYSVDKQGFSAKIAPMKIDVGSAGLPATESMHTNEEFPHAKHKRRF